jgi:pyrroline-5-carboxylate reductase
MKQYPKILVIGAGEMGLSVIASLFRQCSVPHSAITVMTGESHGKNKAALIHKLAAQGIHGIEGCIFEKNPPATLGLQDMVFYCAKPQHLAEIATQYRRFIQPNATIISIAAAKTLAEFKQLWGEDVTVIRTMPHLPQTLLAVYPALCHSHEGGNLADKEQQDTRLLGYDKAQIIHEVLTGLGEIIPLASETEFHAYTAAAGCMPAFIAQFLARQEPKERHHAVQELYHLAKNLKTPLPLAGEVGRGCKTYSNTFIITPSPCPLPQAGGDLLDVSKKNTAHKTQAKTFYQHALAAIETDFPHPLAAKILQDTLRGTLDYLAAHPELSEVEFANAVRSPKGVTNAGLLCMGLPIPDDERFGTAAERAEQNATAAEYAKKYPPEEAITNALKAAKARSQAMEKSIPQKL